MIQASDQRNFARYGDSMTVPNLTEIQTRAYKRFLQEEALPDRRDPSVGLEALFREVFPIVSYDEKLELEYIHYELGKPRYTPDECRELRLTYGIPLRIKIRLNRRDETGQGEQIEETVFFGDIPVMIGGGEFIINGAERVIVSQLHRSPGIDFVVESQELDRPLHACRIIPERGSWIELNVTKKDILVMRIDQSSRLSATTFLRAMAPEYGSIPSVLRLFYETETISGDQAKPEYWAVEPVVIEDEEVVKSGAQLGENATRIQAAGVKKLEVIRRAGDPLILSCLAEDRLDPRPKTANEPAFSEHELALLKIYTRLRPGNPPQLEKAKTLFEEKFYDLNRYRLGKVGRFRLNRKFQQDVPETEMVLRPDDVINALRYLLQLRAGKGTVDDIDHLGNRRLRTIDELATEELRKGFLKLRRTVQERMSVKDIVGAKRETEADKDNKKVLRLSELLNSKAFSSSVNFFFGRSELSQVVDQTNPLSQLTHERRLSALGPGGLNRKRAGFEVRDVHMSHYGRICPIETPEGTNIGLIASLSIYASIDEYGFLVTPYRVVEEAKVNGQSVFLRADQEMEVVVAPPDVVDYKTNRIDMDQVLARVEGDLGLTGGSEVNFVDISPKQVVGVSASLIPFLEHDDANRALMGSNMQRQAVPLLKTEPPIVATGMEDAVAMNSSMVIKARRPGKVTAVDSKHIVIDNRDVYEFRKFVGLNERTCLNQQPVVRLGQRVKKGDVLADGAGTNHGRLSLGKNILVAFMTFDGYNFEDAILVSKKLVKDDAFTSIHIEEYDVEIRETKLGREEFTRDIPNVSERALRNLDDRGVVREGTRVAPGDILVGKIAPKSKTELSPEEKLLHAIFGRAGEDVKNDSLEMPPGEEGVVIGAKRFSRRANMSEEQRKALQEDIKKYRGEINAQIIKRFQEMCRAIEEATGQVMVDPESRQKVGHSSLEEVLLEQVDLFTPDWIKGSKTRQETGYACYQNYWPKIVDLQEDVARKISQMKRGDELPSGVLEMVKIYVATKRQLSVGDKIAGRHGNKGVIARILPEEDMPFLDDGTPVDILLNPLGVPSRMNVGQLLETHLGWAAAVLGFQAITPVFDGAREKEIQECVSQANEHVAGRIKEFETSDTAHPTDKELLVKMPLEGKVSLYDGRTGEPFEQPVTVGYIYMMKLHHLVDEKIHARSTGPYSLITQQPLGGKARTGGQRFGEMEVWGLEAYGASYILQELLTVKSDDVEGRTKIYESMVKGNNVLEAGTPVSFEVLCNEIRGLGLNIQLEKRGI